MKRHGYWNGPPSKRAKTVQLSKTAWAVHSTTQLTAHLCRTIGQFCGTDVPYNPGDMFIRCEKFVPGTSPNYYRSVPILQLPNAPRFMHALFLGETFVMYKVKSVTACAFDALVTQRFHAYAQQTFCDFDVRNIGLLVTTPPVKWEQHGTRRLFPRLRDERDLAQFTLLNLDDALPQQNKEVKYDQEEKKLVLV